MQYRDTAVKSTTNLRYLKPILKHAIIILRSIVDLATGILNYVTCDSQNMSTIKYDSRTMTKIFWLVELRIILKNILILSLNNGKVFKYKT